MKINHALTNLKDIFKILDTLEQDYCIFFGTLLGIIRDKALIEYDKDTDIFLRDFEIQNIERLKLLLIAKGFIIKRHNKDILSAIRNGEYTDLYFFNQRNDFYECMHFIYPEVLLRKIKIIKINDIDFRVPNEYIDLLNKMYGERWDVPIKNYHATGGIKKYGRTNSKFVYNLAYRYPIIYNYIFIIKERFRYYFPVIYKKIKRFLDI